MPSEVKEYFEDGPKKIIKVIPRDDYSLIIYFENNEVRVYDMSDDLYGVFEILKDKNKFNAWDIDKSIDSNIHWNNRIDLCKDAVYINSVPKN